MNSDPLSSIGAALFGRSWKAPLARALGVDLRTIERQLSREAPPGPVMAALSAWVILFEEYSILPPETPWAVFGSAMVPAAPVRRMDLQPSNLVETAHGVLFPRAGNRALARALGLNETSLWRQVHHTGLSGPVIAALRAWLLLHSLTGIHPSPSPWPEASDRPPAGKKMPKYVALLGDDEED